MGFTIRDKRGRLRCDSEGIWGQGPSPHYGPRLNLVPPKIRSFRSVSGNAGTLTQTPHGLYVVAPPQASLASLRIWDRPVRTGQWRETVLLWPLLYPESAVHHCGILLRESTSARLHSISVWDDGTVTVSRWSSPTLFSSNDLAATSFPGLVSFPRVLSIKATDLDVYSFELGDGLGNFHNLFSSTVGSWLRADRIGFYVNAGSANVLAAMTLMSWERTAS